MSMLIAQAMSERTSGKSGQPSITVLDECLALLESKGIPHWRESVAPAKTLDAISCGMAAQPLRDVLASKADVGLNLVVRDEIAGHVAVEGLRTDGQQLRQLLGGEHALRSGERLTGCPVKCRLRLF